MKVKRYWILYVFLLLCNAVFAVSVMISCQYSLLFLFAANLFSTAMVCFRCVKSENAFSGKHSISLLLQTSSVFGSDMRSKGQVCARCFDRYISQQEKVAAPPFFEKIVSGTRISSANVSFA